MINALEATDSKKTQKEEVSILIGKAWVKEGKNFSIAPLTEPVEGQQDKYQISGVYPLIVTEYCRVSFGLNQKADASKNQNTHWAFLNIEKARVDEYKELLGKIGQGLPADGR